MKNVAILANRDVVKKKPAWKLQCKHYEDKIKW